MFRQKEPISFVLAVITMSVVVFLLAPVVLVSWASFGDSSILSIPPHSLSLRWLRRLFENPMWRVAFLNSIQIAFMTATISTTSSLIGAIGIVGLSERARRPLQFIFLLPVVFPPVVVAVGQLVAFSVFGIGDSPIRMALSHVAVVMPISFLIIGMGMFGPFYRYTRLAFWLSPSRFYAIGKVIFPLMSAQVIGAFVVSFLISFDEPILSMFIGGPRTETIPRRIFNSIRYELDPTAASVTLFVFVAWLAAAGLITFVVLQRQNQNRTNESRQH